MTPNLSERLAESQGRPIRLGDSEVHSIYERRVRAHERIRVRRVRASSSPVQATRIKVESGNLLVNGQELRDVVLWSDTTPEVVELTASVGTRGTTLKVWNAWRDHHGTMQAWIGNAGVQIEASGSRIRLRCSDGVGEVCFDDLVLDLEFEPESPKPQSVRSADET